MQTFIPSSISFSASASFLDSKRLNKQIVEAYQIIRINSGLTNGWKNHPAAVMWRGCSGALFDYILACALERFRRTGRWHASVDNAWETLVSTGQADDRRVPSWFGDERVHSSHRGNLLRKEISWYGQFGWTESSDIPYFWPGESK